MGKDKRPRRAMGQFTADDDSAGSGTTIVGGQPPGRQRRSLQGVPIGVEKVLYAAAKDEAFREALLADREAALRSGGFVLRDSEAAMLGAIAPALLRATIEGMNTSEGNVQRRSFLRTVAASAMTVAAVACSDDDGPKTYAGVRSDQAVPDLGPDIDTSRGIRPDMPIDAPNDGGTDADAEVGDATVDAGDLPQSFGIRPDGWNED